MKIYYEMYPWPITTCIYWLTMVQRYSTYAIVTVDVADIMNSKLTTL